MKNMAVCAALFALAATACGKSEKSSTDKPAEPSPTQPTEQAGEPPLEPAGSVPAARDPRIVELLAAGGDCEWNAIGLTTCDTASKLRKLAFEAQSDSALAASCVAALKDDDPKVRGLAASCVAGFNDATRGPHLAAGLDAVEAERKPEVRNAIACAFSGGNAREAGVEDRVIALVSKLASAPETEHTASCLFDSMFPQYLMAGTAPPSKAAGDLALSYLGRSGRLQQRAFDAVTLMKDRMPEVCAALEEVIKGGGDWAQAVDAMARFDAGCSAKLDTAIVAMASAMNENKYNTSEYSATRALLRRVPLTKEQVATLKKASRTLAKKAQGVFQKGAKEIADKLAKYEPPAQKE